MKSARVLLLVDSVINLFLGIILLLYSNPIITFFGLPNADSAFYPNMLGAVLFGIGVALYLEYRYKNRSVGLSLGGAISINLIGGIVLLLWLVIGDLKIPLRGTIILWVLAVVLILISIIELNAMLKTLNSGDE